MMGAYCPCSVAVDEERFGGSGDIWVADGLRVELRPPFPTRRDGTFGRVERRRGRRALPLPARGLHRPPWPEGARALYRRS